MGIFNNKIIIPIFFCENADLNQFKHVLYNLSRRDIKIIDKILDFFIEEDKVKKYY